VRAGGSCVASGGIGERMKLVVFGLTMSSSWGNGHATIWRGLCRALARRGHRAPLVHPDDEDGTPKLALRRFPRFTPELGSCQWLPFGDHRLDAGVRRLRELGVRHLRTGLSWSDSLRPNADAWFDRQMKALEELAVTVTFCFTPESRGVAPHHPSPPQHIEEFAEFCARMVRRHA